MNIKEQLKSLVDIGDNPSFARKIKESYCAPLKASKVDILQINVGKLCNLHCKHCHVQAGSDRKELMPKEILQKCLDVLSNSDISTIDITGGTPEMNPYLEWFINECGKLNRRLIVRSNLVILLDEKYKRFIDIYKKNCVEIVTSLPDYIEAKSDRQRGEGIFSKIVKVIALLNEKGYGAEESNLMIHIVHNPVGAYLPGKQSALEHEYRKRLHSDYGIYFNKLFCITNIPIGRYLEYLINSGNYIDYIKELINAYNPIAVKNVMCRSTVSVGWNGYLYDCDFNQMLDLAIMKAPNHIDEFDIERLNNREIVINNHCYGCTAGSGSSCQGTTTN